MQPPIVSASTSVRFGNFEVDLRAGEVWRNGAKIPLEGQPVRILGLLLARAGELVTREELRAELWTDDTFVDFDHGINDAMKRLRSAIGDVAGTPRFIATLPRRGYRFIFPVDRAVRALPPERHGRRVSGRNIRSIAVLPMKNLSGDPAQDFLGLAMTESLVAHLGRIAALRVVSYQSVIGYRATTKTLPEIARELDVNGLVEGSVVRSGERIRVIASLLQARPERHLFVKTWDVGGEMMAMRDAVARGVARMVRLRLRLQPTA